jgi:hypothetical protein
VLSALFVKRAEDSPLVKKITDYVINRQNADGGYTFCQGAESNLQDIYYGLAILSLLEANFPEAEKTIKFIVDAHFDGIYSIYYVTKASLLLGKSIESKLKKSLLSILNSKNYFGSTVLFSEPSSEFTTTFMALELANLLKVKVNTRDVTNWLLKSRNNDGGFGVQGYSNINSTYYAIASIHLLNESISNQFETIAF